jgi:hypothetical protein
MVRGGDEAAVAGAIPVATDSFHHDVVSMPPGDEADFAVLSSEMRRSRTIPRTSSTRARPSRRPTWSATRSSSSGVDGTIVREFKMLDLLDPYRLCYDGVGGFWSDYYERATRDWSHGNGIVIDPADGSWLVSLRHQDVVVKVDRKSGAIRWMIGDPGRWQAPLDQLLLGRADPGTAWTYHQHAPQVQPDGSILLFDNGNQRAIPPVPPLAPEAAYSRAVEFVVDERARTFRQAWEYGSPPPGTGRSPSFFCPFVGSARHMAKTGNVLLCDGAESVGPSTNQLYARIAEVHRDGDIGIVFEAVIRDRGPEAQSYWAYRAERLPGLYR